MGGAVALEHLATQQQALARPMGPVWRDPAEGVPVLAGRGNDREALGVGRVARAAPDGYTLVIGYWGTHVANGAIYALKYDVLNDFEPVGWVTTKETGSTF